MLGDAGRLHCRSGHASAAGDVLPAAPVNVTLPLPSAKSFDVAVAFGPSDGLLYVWNGAKVLKQNAIDSNSFTEIEHDWPGHAARPGPHRVFAKCCRDLAGQWQRRSFTVRQREPDLWHSVKRR